jgi:hypothetical protein
MKMRILAVLAMAAATVGIAWSDNHSAKEMADAANAFLAALNEEQAQKARFGFEEDERYFFHFIPAEDVGQRYGRPRKGLPLTEMTAPQKHLAHAMLNAGLSRQGYIKAVTVMSLDDILREMEKDTTGRRNSDKYFFSIFGDPSMKGTWGYRVEGHHISLHFTVKDGKVHAAPLFLGSNPAEVRQGPRKGLRALSAEEDVARVLLESFTPAQKKEAIVDPTAYPDILSSANRDAALKGQPSGLHYSKLSAKQKQLLADLIDVYINNIPEDMRPMRRAQVTRSGQSIHFAWAGVEQRGGPHYYRIQTPVFLIEYDNTQNGSNHIHSVWRDLQGDWGKDLLKSHYEHGHHSKEHAHRHSHGHRHTHAD